MPANSKPYLGPEHPLVIELLSEVYRSSQTIFCVIEDGKHMSINVGERLHSLGISWSNVAKVIQTYPFKQLTYQSENMKAIAAGKGKRKKHGSTPNIMLEEDDGAAEEEVLEITKKGKHQRYQLVEQGRYYGCYDSLDATVVLFASERDARRHIYDLLHSRESFHSLCGGKYNRKSQELLAVD